MFFTRRLPSRHAPRCVPVRAQGVLSGARSHSSSVAAPAGWGLGAGGSEKQSWPCPCAAFLKKSTRRLFFRDQPSNA